MSQKWSKQKKLPKFHQSFCHIGENIWATRDMGFCCCAVQHSVTGKLSLNKQKEKTNKDKSDSRMKAGIKPSLLECSGDAKSYYVFWYSRILKWNWSALSSSFKPWTSSHLKNCFTFGVHLPLLPSTHREQSNFLFFTVFQITAKNIHLKLTALWPASRMKMYRKLSTEIALEMLKCLNTLLLDLIILSTVLTTP